MTAASRYGCPVELALDLIGGKWKTVLLSRLKQGPARYRELRVGVPSLSDKMLTQRLHELVERGLVVKESDRYRLSARGKTLEPVLEALYVWGERVAAEDGVAVGS